MKIVVVGVRKKISDQRVEDWLYVSEREDTRSFSDFSSSFIHSFYNFRKAYEPVLGSLLDQIGNRGFQKETAAPLETTIKVDITILAICNLQEDAWLMIFPVPC